MATITTANNNSALNSSRRSYVAVKAFNNDFFKYTVSMNAQYVNVGTLTAVTADDTLTPKGRVLHENGRKLYPGANPDVTSYLVGVYDDVAPFLSGFIDPNSSTFTVYNSDRPNYLAVDEAGEFGAPVMTAGSVEAGAGVTITGGGLTQKVVTLLAAGTATLDLAVGNVFYLPVGTALTAATYTLANCAIGSTFYLVGRSTSSVALTFVGPTGFTKLAMSIGSGSITLGAVGDSSVVTTSSTTARNLITGIVVAA